MKNTIKVFGIIAIVAMIGFSMAACGDEGSDSSTDGRLTITGLSSYSGTIIAWQANGRELYPSKSNDFNSISQALAISGDSVTFYVWRLEAPLWKSYSGNDKNVTFPVSISGSGNSLEGSVTVGFSNGKGSGAFVPNP